MIRDNNNNDTTWMNNILGSISAVARAISLNCHDAFARAASPALPSSSSWSCFFSIGSGVLSSLSIEVSSTFSSTTCFSMTKTTAEQVWEKRQEVEKQETKDVFIKAKERNEKVQFFIRSLCKERITGDTPPLYTYI